MEIKNVYKRSPASRFVIESYPESASRNEMRLAEKRAEIIASLFAEEFKIPGENIKKVIHNKTMKMPTVKVSVRS